MFGTIGQIKATRALLKFCREHDHAAFWIGQLEKCLHHLERGERDDFFRVYESFKRAGMGCFMDWYPPVVFDNENDEYLETLFWALDAHWHANIRLADKGS